MLPIRPATITFAKCLQRRNFIKNSSLVLGLGIGGISIPSIGSANPPTYTGEVKEKKNSREVRVASVSLKDLWPETTRESRIKRILERME